MIHANADIISNLAKASKDSNHTIAISATEVVTETPTVGTPVILTSIAAASNDAAKGEACAEILADALYRRKV